MDTARLFYPSDSAHNILSGGESVENLFDLEFIAAEREKMTLDQSESCAKLIIHSVS